MKFNHAVKKMDFFFTWFFEPLGPKWKYSEEKIHLCYHMIKGLLTDYYGLYPFTWHKVPISMNGLVISELFNAIFEFILKVIKISISNGSNVMFNLMCIGF